MKLPTITLLAIACCAAAPPARADDAGLSRCRAVADSAVRLACYDALPVGAAPVSAGVPPKPVSNARAPDAFGLPETPGSEVTFIDSQINGRFAGWEANQQIELANGQIWRIADGSRAYADLSHPKVRIERGAFSAFYMVVAGLNQAPRVRRVK